MNVTSHSGHTIHARKMCETCRGTATKIGGPCDNCSYMATFAVFAAYDVANPAGNVHPRVARYPMPMFRTCATHLIERLEYDAATPLSTRLWVIEPRGIMPCPDCTDGYTETPLCGAPLPTAIPTKYPVNCPTCEENRWHRPDYWPSPNMEDAEQ